MKVRKYISNDRKAVEKIHFETGLLTEPKQELLAEKQFQGTFKSKNKLLAGAIP